MRQTLLVVGSILLCGALFALVLHYPARSSASATPTGPPNRTPVVVELFTSEGCSSCPPADELLKKLSEDQPFDHIEILALEEHVDYWNTLGWTDRFSSADFSRRQEQYDYSFADGGVYTPQMIVDGSAQFVGNRTHEARDQVRWAAAHAKTRLLLSVQPGSNGQTRTVQVQLDANAAPANFTKQDLWIAVTEKNLRSQVTAGENSGEQLVHAPVVRLLRKEKRSASSALPASLTITIQNDWNPANLAVVAFLADPKSHNIVAAGSSPI